MSIVRTWVSHNSWPLIQKQIMHPWTFKISFYLFLLSLYIQTFICEIRVTSGGSKSPGANKWVGIGWRICGAKNYAKWWIRCARDQFFWQNIQVFFFWLFSFLFLGYLDLNWIIYFALKATSHGVLETPCRDYNAECERQKSVEEFYRLQHINQTYDFVSNVSRIK